MLFLAESTKCRLSNEIVVDLSKKAVAEDGIGPEEDHVVINILRKGKDISENDKIKGLIERYQKKNKKGYRNNFVRYGGIIVSLFRIMNAQEFI